MARGVCGGGSTLPLATRYDNYIIKGVSMSLRRATANENGS